MSYIDAVKGDECSCGRRASIMHCPICGSTRIYARQSRHHKMLDGSTKFVEIQYRCQRCGQLFIDEERTSCGAPPTRKELAKRRALVLGEELMRSNPERAHEILNSGGDVGRALKEEYLDHLDHPTLNNPLPDPIPDPIPNTTKLIDSEIKRLRDQWLELRLGGSNKVPKVFEEYLERISKGEVF